MFWCPMSAYEKIVSIVGSKAELARRLGMSPQRVGNWETRGIPADQAENLARIVKNKVSKSEMCPHVFYPKRTKKSTN